MFAASRRLPSRMGTAPLRPAKSTKASSPRRSLAGIRHRPTNNGRMIRAMEAPSTRPGTHTSVRVRSARCTVRPSTTNATISPRLASAEWKRSISRLKGARSSPRTMPATKTARKPEPCAMVVAPYRTSTHASVRSGYRPSLGSETRRMNHSRARPPKSPKATPMPIWRMNSPPTCTRAPPLSDPAASRLIRRAMPTGSFAPDSPSRIVEERPAISRCPRMENTTPGSVGATAVPSRSATYQLNPNPKCATAATATVVRNVPATPTTTMGAAAAWNRRQPMCMPPSNRMHISATVTMRSTIRSGGALRPGTTAAARAAAARNSAGAGTRSRAVSRLESTSTTAASDRRSSSWAKGPTSVMDLLGRGSGHLVADQTSRRTTVSLSAQDPGPGSNWSAGAGSDGNKKMKGIGRAAHPIPFTCEVSCSWLPLAGTGSEAALDQGHDARVGQGGDVADLAVLGHVLEQTAHDLARAGLGQLVDDHDLARLGDRADLLGYVVTQDDERTHRLTGYLVLGADDGGFCHLWVRHERRLDLGGGQAVARDVHDVVDPPEQP